MGRSWHMETHQVDDLQKGGDHGQFVAAQMGVTV